MKYKLARERYFLRNYYGLNVHILIAFLFLSVNSNLYAQKVDASFQPDIYANVTNGEVKVTTLQTDGKLLIGGSFNSVSGYKRAGIARLNSNGSLDESFDPRITSTFNINSIALQPDGRILVGGTRGNLIRLNIDGNIDSSFSPDYPFATNPNNNISTLSVQSDGKVIVGGLFLGNNSSSIDLLVRLKPNGSVDEGFKAEIKRSNPMLAGQYNGVVTSLIQHDGKILVAGSSLESTNSIGEIKKGSILRFLPDGKIDQDFQVNLSSQSYVSHLALQSDSKIVTLGSILSRFNQDGSKDDSFVPNVTTLLSSLAVQADGKLLVGQRFNERLSSSSIVPGNHNIVRLNNNGTLDATFNSGTKISSAVNSMSIRSDGQIYIGGNFTEVDQSKEQGVALLKADGTLDKSFNTGDGIVTGVRVYSTIVQPDGKIVIGGDFDKVDGIRRTGIARLNSNGSLDQSFNPGTGIEHTSMGIRVVKLQPDGKMIIGGNFVSYNGIDRRGLARLNADGSLDTNFNPAIIFRTAVTYAIDLQPDGKIIIGGLYYLEDNSYRVIYRLHQDGTLDNSFSSNSGINNTLTTLVVQPDGKILIGGHFTAIGNSTRIRFARLDSNGNLDNGFVPEITSLSSTPSFALQPDGKVLVGGFLRSLDGSITSPIVRLNSNGKLDSFFSQAEGTVYGIYVESNGKILVNGNFNFSGGTVYYGLTRLHENFNLDNNFDSYSQGISPSYSLSFQSNGEIILGGWTSFVGVSRFNVLQRVELPEIQKITFAGIGDKVFGAPSFSLNATSSSGLPVSFAIISGPATLAGNRVSITGAGKLRIKALQNGNSDWEPATEVEQEICVNPTKPIITPNGDVLTSNSTLGNQWYRNGKVIEGANSQKHTITMSGSYTVTVSVDGCQSSHSDTYIVLPRLTAISITTNNTDATMAKVGDAVTISLTASEPIKLPTVTIAGRPASVTAVAASTTQFTARYTMASGDAEGQVPFLISYQDEAGNIGTPVSATTNGSKVVFDKTHPTITLSTPTSVPTNAAFTVTFTFSEAVTGFAINDIAVVNGAASEFNATSASVYSAKVTPIAQGTVSISVRANAAQDAAGNGNTASPVLTRAFDSVAPSGYAVAFNQNLITFSNKEAVSVKVTGAEMDATYSYTISSTGGGTPVHGTGSVTAAVFDINNINVTALADGQLTLSLRLTDAASNVGAEVTAKVNKNTRNLIGYTRPANVNVPFLRAYSELSASLPTTIEASFSDNTKAFVSVSWQADGYNGAVAGSYELSGMMALPSGVTNSSNIKAAITVVVAQSQAPTAIALSRSDIDENNAVGAVVGTLSSTDADAGDSHAYSLVTGEGSADNASFTIEGYALKAAKVFDYETRSSYSVRIRSTDRGDKSFESVKVITINDVQETVTGIADEENTQLRLYPNPSKGVFMITLDTAIETVRLVDSRGSIVLTLQVNAQQALLNVEGVGTGVYTAIITSKDKVYSRRVVVSK